MNLQVHPCCVFGYDELGRLVAKTYGSGQDAFADSLKYNIQGWLTEKKSPYFEMALHYYDPAKGTDPSYTGNITEWEWTHKDPSAPGPGTANTYAFTYDKLSRLTNTVQYEGAGTTPVDSFVEQGLSYDKNGNFLTLQRYAAGSLVDNIDNAVYNGNQIDTIRNNGTSCTYAYDANGNCTTDGLNSLNLEYNFLNLTSAARDASDNLRATYRWLADGTKLGVVDTDGMGYDYVGSLIYKRDALGELVLESTGFGGGRIEVSESSNGNIYTPNYFLTDHLGSTRVVAKPGGNGITIAERSDYYAFGGRQENPDLEASYNRFHFSGKEDQTSGKWLADGTKLGVIDKIMYFTGKKQANMDSCIVM